MYPVSIEALTTRMKMSRSPERTPAWVMLLRFLAFGIPGAIFVFLVFPALPFVLLFFGVMAAVFGLNWLFTNSVVKTFTPDYYEALKRGGGDPYLDNLGWPLNSDSEATRQHGLHPNVFCPHCGAGSFVEPGATVVCPSCGGHFKHG